MSGIMKDQLPTATVFCESFQDALRNDPCVSQVMAQGGTVEDACVALVNKIHCVMTRIIALESIAPKKIQKPDGSVWIWRCPEDLVPVAVGEKGNPEGISGPGFGVLGGRVMSCRAPWSPKEVANLISRQDQDHLHSYTCTSGHTLTPQTDGWICDECGYNQDWCHSCDADGNWPPPQTFSGPAT